VTRFSKPLSILKNQILLQLSEGDRKSLLGEADQVRMPVGYTLARAGDEIAFAYFPDTGIISLVSEMTTGHQVAVATVGSEGVVGLEYLFHTAQYPQRLVVLVESSGYRVPVDRFERAFNESEAVRRVTLTHIGRRMTELTIAAACYRAHSHRQRLARWLLTTTDRARQQSLRVTHETLAQMVGGPRHAVTVALNELRAKGATDHLRGKIEVVKRSVLIAHACECYGSFSQNLRR
jgi:CRP-like cAMP-binding protein